MPNNTCSLVAGVTPALNHLMSSNTCSLLRGMTYAPNYLMPTNDCSLVTGATPASHDPTPLPTGLYQPFTQRTLLVRAEFHVTQGSAECLTGL